ncbi:MAG: type I-A CRISPR-associated protein Cas5a [Candidatus Caldarchaeum sp.]
MMSLTLELTVVWGYSIKAKKVAKSQHAHPLPPPSTLIGAIAKGLAQQDNSGETILTNSKIASRAQHYTHIFRAASTYLDTRPNGLPYMGKYWEDPIRYQILQFQREERRHLPNFRFNIVPAGKVYSPSSRLVVGYLIDEAAAKKTLGEQWENRLCAAAYMLTHLGSKESIVAVEEVELREASKHNGQNFETRFYQKAGLVRDARVVDRGPYGLGGIYVETFWENDYNWGAEPASVEYIVPGSRDPVTSCKMTVTPNPRSYVYMVGEDGIVIST